MGDKHQIDLSLMSWTVTGYTPYEWQLSKALGWSGAVKEDVSAVKARVPGSVQQSLLGAGAITDWNIGLQSRQCEWVENRHWLYEMTLPEGTLRPGSDYRLVCLGLDGCGEIFVNGRSVYRFENGFVPHRVDLKGCLGPKDNVLQILFECPPRWLGQFYYTSRIRDFKARFNYTWDWTSRLVQIGIWDGIYLESCPTAEIETLTVQTDFECRSQTGLLTIGGDIKGEDESQLKLALSQDGRVLREATCSVKDFRRSGLAWKDLKINPWQPNGQGDQPLYELVITLADKGGKTLDTQTRRIGFKHVEWWPCEGAPAHADPWVCVVNGQPVFLQGVNWTPIRPNYADVTEADYRLRLEAYRKMGCNILRVWGGAFLEKQCFYEMCDEMGLMIWQEFPLSSSGIENYPPEDPQTMDGLCAVAASYIERRHHHVCLLLWGGGNELTTRGKDTRPIDQTHPLLKKFGQLVQSNDPLHRFAATSPSGPSFSASAENFGKGLHWDIHGPWKVEGLLDQAFESFWQNDDSLFRSEVGAPGPSDTELILKYKGDCSEMPIDNSNPLWRRTGWWTENEVFQKELGRPPKNLAEYVQWGQRRQAKILATMAQSCKGRFPRCGGIIIWMGHDCFPCAANTSIIDFEGNLKPAAMELEKIFKTKP